MKSYVAIGLMSGTSVDAVDASVIRVSFDGDIGELGGLRETEVKLETVGNLSYPIPSCLREEIFNLFKDNSGSLERLSVLNMRLGFLFAEVVGLLLEKTGLTSRDVTVIGSHGQTVYHVADFVDLCGMKVRGSIQIGEGSVIAQKTGIPVVSDFRVADIAAGGNGAPLVPFLDVLLFGKLGKDIAVQNIGGIGNVTWIPENGKSVLAFDTGPGNMIIDALVMDYTGGKIGYDRNGDIGKRGKVIPELLARWMKRAYFKKKPPKSTGREEFGEQFIREELAGVKITPDVIRTAEEYTAYSIAYSYMVYLPKRPDIVVVTGGGVHNPIIMESLKSYLKDSKVVTGEVYGISSDFKEAIAFGLLGLWSFLRLKNNLPQATGADYEVIMGKVSYP